MNNLAIRIRVQLIILLFSVSSVVGVAQLDSELPSENINGIKHSIGVEYQSPESDDQDNEPYLIDDVVIHAFWKHQTELPLLVFFQPPLNLLPVIRAPPLNT